MKISVLQPNLKQALGIVGRVVAHKSTLPICSSVLLTATEGGLQLAATNLEQSIALETGAKIAATGQAAIPAKLLSDVVNTLPDERVDMEVSDKHVLTLRCGNVKTNIKGYNPADFPTVPVLPETPLAQIEAAKLREAIAHALVSVAQAHDDTRPVLAGVYTKLAGREATLVGANGFTLSVYHLPLSGEVVESTEYIIPGKAMTELVRMLGDEQELVDFYATPGRNQVGFRVGKVQIVTQLISGTFPNWLQLIPQNLAGRVCMPVEAFKQAVKATGIFAATGNGAIRLYPMQEDDINKLRLAAQGDETGDNAIEITARMEGEPTRIGLNYEYLRDILAVFGSGEVSLQTNKSNGPAMLTQVGNDSFLHVIMPMFLQWGEEGDSDNEP